MQVLTRSDRGPTPPDEASPPTGADQLGILTDRAAELDIDQGSGWLQLRADASAVLDALVDAGHLPAHLVIADDDPPPVVARVIVAARRRSKVPGPVPHRR
jgi:hypothetical protein